MKQFYLLFIICFTNVIGFSQTSFHIFPKDDVANPGSSLGDGTLDNPWDLQTALSQKPQSVNGGDTIWLHNGIYTGRFVSKLRSTNQSKQIVVSSAEGEWAVLNGNIKSSQKEVLSVYSEGVTFSDFEVTWLGDFSRHVKDSIFLRSDGINHYSGRDCEFLNLVIHNNPGSGFGSWKNTSNALIENCLIYKNGFYSEKRGRGVGIYIQNASSEMRIIKGNTIFNNYYKGVEIWSASRRPKNDYVKNVIFENNVLFNSGLISGRFRDNLIVATDDVTNVNIAKNIHIKNNIFYHNVSLSEAIENTDAPSLTLGFNQKAPIKDVVVENNLIIGRKDAIRFLCVNSITFKNNTVYSGYVRFTKNNLNHINSEHWNFDNNTYYTRKAQAIRFQSLRDYNLSQWFDEFGLDKNSKWQSYKNFEIDSSVRISKNPYKQNTFRVTVFSENESDVKVGFSEYKLPLNSKYKIRDVENLDSTLDKGILDETAKVNIPMSLKRYPSKTLNNFGVFIISFEKEEETVKESDNFFKRIFNWLGF